MDTSLPLTDQVYDLAQGLLRTGLTDSDIAAAGGMSRQAVNNRGINRPLETRPQLLGFGFAVVRAGYQHGHVAEVLSILSGRDVVGQTVSRTGALISSLTEGELASVLKVQHALGRVSLTDSLIREIVSLRASRV